MAKGSIYKFSYLMNERVSVSAMTGSREKAEERLRKLFGDDNHYDFVGQVFSHTIGSYSIASHVKRSEASEDMGGDLIDNVVSAYAKGQKINL